MDRAVAELDGRHFTIEGPVRRVEATIAPAVSAAAPYYTRPSLDSSRSRPHLAADPGRDPLPGVEPHQHLVPRGRPGHHLQLARWAQLAAEFVEAGPSIYQTRSGPCLG